MCGYEWPSAPFHHRRTWRKGKWCAERRRLWYHCCFWNHGNPLPLKGYCRSERKTRKDYCWLYLWQDRRPKTGNSTWPACRGCDVRTSERCFETEPGTDTGAYTCNRAWRTICQYRARMQLTDGDQNGNEACRLCDHRSRIRRRLRGREIPGYQMPYGRNQTGCSRDRSNCKSSQV